MNQLCRIRCYFPQHCTLHDHVNDQCLRPNWWQVVGGPQNKIYNTWCPWYGQFKVGYLQTPQLWPDIGIPHGSLVLVSTDTDLCHIQTHPTWFEPPTGYRSWLAASNLPAGQCHGQGNFCMLVDSFISPNTTMAYCLAGMGTCSHRSIPQVSSSYGKWGGS